MIAHITYSSLFDCTVKLMCKIYNVNTSKKKKKKVVFADADLDKAAHDAVFFSFFNTGQVCCSVERVYVDAAVKDEFEKRVLDYAQSYNAGIFVPVIEYGLGLIFCFLFFCFFAQFLCSVLFRFLRLLLCVCVSLVFVKLRKVRALTSAQRLVPWYPLCRETLWQSKWTQL
jgi:hypothetical protein